MPLTLSRLIEVVADGEKAFSAFQDLRTEVIEFCNDNFGDSAAQALLTLINLRHPDIILHSVVRERMHLDRNLHHAETEKLRQRRKRQMALQRQGRNEKQALSDSDTNAEIKRQIAANIATGKYGGTTPAAKVPQPKFTCGQETCYTPSDCECAEECLFSSPEMAAVPTFEEAHTEVLPGGAARLAHADAKLDTVLGGDIFAKADSDV